MATKVKRQHYVPRTYLKHFAVEKNGNHFLKSLPIDDLDINKIFDVSVGNACAQKDIYTLPGTSTEEKMLLETFYSDNYESHYDQIYQILTNENKRTITTKDRELIISTIVTMMYRTTKLANQHYENVNRALKYAYQVAKRNNSNFILFENDKINIEGKTLDEIQKQVREDSQPMIAITQLKVAFKLIQLRSSRDVINVVRLKDDSHEFVTSDNPVLFRNIFGKHSSSFDKENILSLPLDAKHILYLMPFAKENERTDILYRRNTTGSMGKLEKSASNHSQSKNAERFMIGSEAGLKEFLKDKDYYNTPLTDKQNDELQNINAEIKKNNEILKNILRDTNNPDSI